MTQRYEISTAEPSSSVIEEIEKLHDWLITAKFENADVREGWGIQDCVDVGMKEKITSLCGKLVCLASTNNEESLMFVAIGSFPRAYP
jgi:hypothetical protein